MKDIKQIKKFLSISYWKSFLFENLGVRQTLAKNTFWLSFAEAISKVLKLVLFIYVARVLGAEEYGKFSFALSFVGLFVIFSHLGLFKIITREFAKGKEEKDDFPALLSLKVFLSAATIVLIVIGSFFITPDSLIRFTIFILGLELVLSGFLNFFYSFFRAREKMEFQALGQVLQVAFITIFGLLVVFYLPSVKNLALSYGLGSFLCLLFIFFIFHFRISPVKFKINPAKWKFYLALSYPLALVAVLSSIHANIDSTIMGSFGLLRETGWYNAAQRIVQAAFVFNSLIAASFFPLLARIYQEKERFNKILVNYLKISVFLVLPIVAGGIFLAPRLIDFVYDPSFAPATLAFQILIIGFGISSLGAPFNYTLIVANQQKKIFWVALSAALFNVLLNIVLIPKYSLYGASFATLLTMLLTFLITVKFALKHAAIKGLGILGIYFLAGAIASGIMLIAILRLNFNVLWLVLTGFLVYAASFLLLKKAVFFRNKPPKNKSL